MSLFYKAYLFQRVGRGIGFQTWLFCKTLYWCELLSLFALQGGPVALGVEGCSRGLGLSAHQPFTVDSKAVQL